MKKILAFLLALMLLLPAISLGEAAEDVDIYPIEFDDFTLYATSYDAIQKAAAKENGQLLFLLYPNYDETAMLHNNINSIWISDNLLPSLPDLDINAFAQETLVSINQQLNDAGLAATNSQVISAEKDDAGVILIVFSNDVDYSAAGIDLQATLYQAQYYICLGEKGTYFFTLTAYNPDELAAMFSYVEAIEFKE